MENFTVIVNGLNERLTGVQDKIDAALTFDNGIVSQRVGIASTVNIDVLFNGEFINPPIVTLKLRTCVAYNGTSMAGYITISSTGVTRTGFVLTITNTRTSNGYYADCTIEWTAEASE